MYNLSRWLGWLSTAEWLLAALTAAASGFLKPHSLSFNLVSALLFLSVAGLIAWRLWAMSRAGHIPRQNTELGALHLVDAATYAALATSGAILLSGVAFRVLGEGLPLFG